MPLADLLSPLLSSRCATCGDPGPALCRLCRFSLASTRAVRPVPGVRAAMPFDGVGRRAVLAMKYGNRRPLAAHLARLLVARLGLTGGGRDGVDVVTWAPSSATRVRERGFDQAELLAREVARELRVPCRRLLHRTHGAAQTGRTRAERTSDRPGFRVRPGTGEAAAARAAAPSRLRVLVVDDVVTTGATLLASAAALHEAGVADVRLVAVAATPAPAQVVDLAAAAARRSRPRLAAGRPVGSIPA